MLRTISAIAVDREIRAANRGRLPYDEPSYRRAAARFGYTVAFHPAPFRPDQSCIEDGIIHVPSVIRGRPLDRCHRHELSEACLRWEGREPWIEPETPKGAKHELSRCVDLLEPRGYLTQDLERRLRQLMDQAAGIAADAGLDVLTLSRKPSGNYALFIEWHGRRR